MAYDPVAREDSRTALWVTLGVVFLLILASIFWYQAKYEPNTVVINPAPTVVVPTPEPPSPPIIVNPVPPVIPPVVSPPVVITPRTVITKNREKETIITRVATPTPEPVREESGKSDPILENPLTK
jgi:hypothetical protein